MKEFAKSGSDYNIHTNFNIYDLRYHAQNVYGAANVV